MIRFQCPITNLYLPNVYLCCGGGDGGCGGGGDGGCGSGGDGGCGGGGGL